MHFTVGVRVMLMYLTIFHIVGSRAMRTRSTVEKKQKDVTIPLAIGSEVIVGINKKNKVSRYCVQGQPGSSLFYTLSNYFVQTTVSVQSNFPLRWYSVRGKSTDDFYSMMRATFFRYVLGIKEDEERELMKTRDLVEGYGYLRDMFSSCPSPLFDSPELTKCKMRFSPVGEPCVVIDVEGSLSKGSKVRKPEIVIETKQSFNRRGFIMLLIGLTLIKLSKELSKSKTVQYLVGAVTFVVIGFLVIGWNIASRMLTERETKKGDNRKMNIGLALLGAYGVSVIYFLRTHLRAMLLIYWEFTLLYVILMSTTGCFFVYMMRSRRESKNVFRVVGKHVARLVGLIALFHSSSSPLASTLAIIGSLFNYIRYKALKKAPHKP